jgi:hypothetical protein
MCTSLLIETVSFFSLRINQVNDVWNIIQHLFFNQKLSQIFIYISNYE